MKKTLLYSTILAGLLNLWQFASSYSQRQSAFTPPWENPNITQAPKTAQPAHTLPTPTPVPASPTHTDPASDVAAKLQANGLKPDYAALYLSVQAATGTPWQILAAVHRVETTQSGDTARASYAGATGPMQFMPATFRAYALDGDGDGIKNITDLDDAMLTAGNYLAAGGASHGQYSNALHNYNHSWSYVSKVMGLAKRLGL